MAVGRMLDGGSIGDVNKRANASSLDGLMTAELTAGLTDGQTNMTADRFVAFFQFFFFFFCCFTRPNFARVE